MSKLQRQALKIGLYGLAVAGLIVVFLMYFRTGLILDIANFIWRCA